MSYTTLMLHYANFVLETLTQVISCINMTLYEIHVVLEQPYMAVI